MSPSISARTLARVSSPLVSRARPSMRPGLGLGRAARLHLGTREAFALLAQALLELRLRGELRFGQDFGLQLRARLLLEFVPQELLHLAADARLDLLLEARPHLMLRVG